MAMWQEREFSSQDVSLDQEGYVHCTRTFAIINGNPRNFFAPTIGSPHPFLTIPKYGVGTGTPTIQPDFLPDYGHIFKVGSGPAALVNSSTDSTRAVDQPVFLHAYTLSPHSAVLFYAVAHYTNDPRMSPLGQSYHTSEQQSFVGIPYTRQDPIVVQVVSGSSIKSSVSERVHSQPMSVDTITHTIVVPRTSEETVKARSRDQAIQRAIHELPWHGPCAYLGCDTQMQGVQWMSVTYRWQWQAGIVNMSSVQPKSYRADGSDAGPILVEIPPQQDSLIPALAPHPMVLPPFHTLEMRTGRFTAGGGGVTIETLATVWDLRCPYKYIGNGWRALMGSEKFIWN